MAVLVGRSSTPRPRALARRSSSCLCRYDEETDTEGQCSRNVRVGFHEIAKGIVAGDRRNFHGASTVGSRFHRRVIGPASAALSRMPSSLEAVRAAPNFSSAIVCLLESAVLLTDDSTQSSTSIRLRGSPMRLRTSSRLVRTTGHDMLSPISEIAGTNRLSLTAQLSGFLY